MKTKLLSFRPWIILVSFACLALFAFLWSFSPSSAGVSGIPAGGTPDLALTVFAEGLDQPIGISHAGDNRLFVIEQPGTIQIVQPDGTVLGTPFLDITGRVEYGAGPGNEQGLLGLAFDPNYASNGYFYVNYTYCNIADCPDYGATANLFTRISRFSVTGNANIADPNSEQILLTIPQPYGEHNGGDLKFGPDGYLYIGMGDGGSADDPDNRAQNGMELLGKMLRIDVDGGGLSPECDPTGNYTIPADNPFVSAANTCNEIWQFGLRNPWRFSFDRLTGDMYIGDVGEQGWEEVDFSPASSNGGENWGWRCYEGNHAHLTDGCGPIENYDFPIFEYEQTTQRCAVMGGYVYRGGQYPVLYGHYIFSDYCKGDFWTAIYNGSSWTVTFQGDLANHLIAFGENADGEIFITGSNGKIYHVIENTTFQTPTITPTGTNTPTPTPTPTATPKANLTPVTTGFLEPVDVENAGGEQLYVAERGGKVYEVTGDGTLNPTPLLDISDQVSTDEAQRGLLSIAFHPDYTENGYLYAQYTDLNGDVVVSRFTDTNLLVPQAIDPGTESIVLTATHPLSTTNNNGGELAFGPDGYLYISLGDGGDTATSQDVESLFGKVLRIDVDGGSPYAIPADNPYVGDPNAREEIWALGFRNPWRYSFDSQTGDLYIGDVGGSQKEEIDLLSASSLGGDNFGWSCYEGTAQGPDYDPGTCTATYIPPIHEYPHTDGAVVVGGYTYRSCQYADMEGKYYFADFGTGNLWSLTPNGQGGYTVTTLLSNISQQIVSFGQGADGELYVLDYSGGTLYHLTGNEIGSCYVYPVTLWVPVVLKP